MIPRNIKYFQGKMNNTKTGRCGKYNCVLMPKIEYTVFKVVKLFELEKNILTLLLIKILCVAKVLSTW